MKVKIFGTRKWPITDSETKNETKKKSLPGTAGAGGAGEVVTFFVGAVVRGEVGVDAFFAAFVPVGVGVGVGVAVVLEPSCIPPIS